jgi:hypothetical protein
MPRAPRHRVVDQYPSPDQGEGLFVADLSCTGARVCTRNLAPVGAQIDIRCTFVEDDLYSVIGIADVVRRNELTGEMGLRFVWLTPESKEALLKLEGRRARPSPARRRSIIRR